MNALNVLVVDDDRDFAESLAAVLELKGHRTTTSFSAGGALAHLTHDDIDIAFMDISLPGLSGIDALRVIHNLKSSAKIVMMTGHNADRHTQEARLFGALDVLQKPFDPMQLLEKIESLARDPEQQ